MIEQFDKLIPIIALIVGWFLNELHNVFAARQSHSVALRQALAQLLEVRFQLKVIEHLVAEIKARAPEAQQHMPQFRSFFEALIGDEGSAAERYQSAVETVAGSDPFIAFQLASRNRIGMLFQRWRHTALSAGAQGVELEKMESELKQILSPKLDEILIEVAGAISWRAKRNTKQIVSAKFEIPPELSDLLNKSAPTMTTNQS